MYVSWRGLLFPCCWVFWRVILPFCGIKLKQAKQSKAGTDFPPHVRSIRMGKGISCLAFTWSRSHDHTNDQSYLQYTVSLIHSSLRLNATCDSRHSTLLNKRSTHKELPNPNIYLHIMSSYIRLLLVTRSYHFIIVLHGAIVIVLT